jgi:hypothetical protein
MPENLVVGDKVKTKVWNLLGNNKPGAIGYVYETYSIGGIPGASIIFQNGNFDGFSLREQAEMVEFIEHVPFYSKYVFRNVNVVWTDYLKDYWVF